MSDATVVLTIPADRYEWGTLTRVGEHMCMQTAKLYRDDRKVCDVTVTWPAPLPTVPVVCHSEGRCEADRD